MFIQKSFTHPSWCLIAAIRWPLSLQSVLSDDQHVESLVGRGLKSLQITDDTKDTCGSCSGFYSCWLWTRQNLATLECTCFYNHFGCETNKTQSGPNHKKPWPILRYGKIYKYLILVPWNEFSLNFALNCQGIVKKIVAEPRPGSTTLRPFWTPIVRNGVKWVAPMHGRKQIGYVGWTKTV